MTKLDFDPKELSRAVLERAITLSAISIALILSCAVAVGAYLVLRLGLVVVRILESFMRGSGL